MRLILLLLACLFSLPARAEFSINSAILEFTQDSPRQQDIELVNRGDTNDYIVSEVNAIENPGSGNEKRVPVKDPLASMLLVTPDKTVLAANSRRVLRFVLLKEPDDKEHVYRVAVKPVIKGVENNARLGLKVLVGYEVLVIIRPAVLMPAYNATREGQALLVSNTGNTGILFQGGQQCSTMEKECRPPPAMRVYPGQKTRIPLPKNAPVSYSVWDGKSSAVKQFN